jgi:hypothetical protein
MAKLVLTGADISLAGTNISANVAQVTISTSVAEVETTSFGSGGAVTRVGGLKDNSLTLSIHQDYPTIENLVYPLIGSTAEIVVKPTSAAVGSGNPSFTADVLIVEWSPVNGAVGDLAAVDVTWPISGTITKAV